MYEELVKMLRTCAERDSCIGWKEACPYLGTGVCDNKAEKAADAIEELMRRCEQFQYMPPPAWIPVTERLPEQFKPVLVYYNRNGYSGTGVAEYYHDGDTKVWRGCGFIPTHWMPLPEPPKEE